MVPYIFFCAVIIGCTGKKELSNNDKVKLHHWEPVKLVEYVPPDFDLNSLRTNLLNRYIDSVRFNLSEDKIPINIMDLCLDERNVGYCYLNSHNYISLRKDIIDSLTLFDINKIISLVDTSMLGNLCDNSEVNSIEEHYYITSYKKYSTLNMIKDRIKILENNEEY